MFNNSDIIGVSNVAAISNIDEYVFGSHRIAYNIINKKNNKEIFNCLNKNIRIDTNVQLFEHDNIKYINDEVVILDVYPSYYHFMVDILGKFLYINSINKAKDVSVLLAFL